MQELCVSEFQLNVLIQSRHGTTLTLVYTLLIKMPYTHFFPYVLIIPSVRRPVKGIKLKCLVTATLSLRWRWLHFLFKKKGIHASPSSKENSVTQPSRVNLKINFICDICALLRFYLDQDSSMIDVIVPRLCIDEKFYTKYPFIA